MNNNKHIYIDHILEKINNNLAMNKKARLNIDNIPKIKVACILDRFSYDCLKYEAAFYQLGVDNWKETIDMINPDLLFVESAWEGYNQQWINKIANMKENKDKALIKITDYCKTNNIPTVFWAKEDPTDFYIFSEAAKYFEYVFTTDINCISKHKQILCHNNVYLLPLAAQPQLHNPINKDEKKVGKIAFAGSWYRKFENRGKYMHNLLRPARKHGLVIYNRFHYLKDDQFAFPVEYKPYLKKGLDYSEMVKEYKKYEIFLNVNSDDTSPTAFSRRMFELLACGIPVISSYNPGIVNYFKDTVMISNSEKDTEKHLERLLKDRELRDKISLLGQREIFNNHTYKQRFNTLLNTIGLRESEEKPKGVSIITHVTSALAVDNILNNYMYQNYSPRELILIIEDEIIELVKRNIFLKKHNDIVLLKLPNKTSIGKTLNLAIAKSKYHYISIFDDNSYYAPNYLIDIINSFKYTKAHITGKQTIYEYLVDSKKIVLNNPEQEYKFTKNICNSTYTFEKDLCTKVKFKDDSGCVYASFLQDCTQKGFEIYSSDRFNHIFMKNISKKKIDRRFIEEKFRSTIV